METNLCSKRGRKYDNNSPFILFRNPLFVLQYIKKKKKKKERNGDSNPRPLIAPNRTIVHSANIYLLIYKRVHELSSWISLSGHCAS